MSDQPTTADAPQDDETQVEVVADVETHDAPVAEAETEGFGTAAPDVEERPSGSEGEEGEGATVDPVQAFKDDLASRFGEWYVIHSYAGYENRVKANLENRIAMLPGSSLPRVGTVDAGAVVLGAGDEAVDPDGGETRDDEAGNDQGDEQSLLAVLLRV